MHNPIEFVLGSFTGTTVDDTTGDQLTAGMNGVTLFREDNVRTLDQVVELCAQLHAACGDLPALVAVDQEGGQLQTMSGIVTDFPGNMALAATGDVALAERVGAAVGSELRALGVTVNYAPVCDLLTVPTNHGLSIRSYGDDPASAAAFAAAQITGLQRAGIAATAKHFPGKGGATVDTHYATAVIDRSRAEFDAYELVPFLAAIGADVRLMMTSHAIAPALSPGNERPATLSPEVLTGLLRDELGFGGVTITDALDMAAVGEADQASAAEALDAIRAGSDLLLTTPRMDIAAMTAGLRNTNEVSPIDPQLLSRSRARVVALRHWLAGFTVPDLSVVGSSEHAALADEVARRSITEITPAAVTDPIDRECVVIQPALINLTPADTTIDSGASLAAALRGMGLSPTELVLAHSPTPVDLDAAVGAAAGRDVVLLVTAAATEPGQVELVRRVVDCAARATVIVARNPLDLGSIDTPTGTRVLCSYGFTISTIRALAAVLTGSRQPVGHLPVRNPNN
jgi:beta-N-acetylhexosaminidase